MNIRQRRNFGDRIVRAIAYRGDHHGRPFAVFGDDNYRINSFQFADFEEACAAVRERGVAYYPCEVDYIGNRYDELLGYWKINEKQRQVYRDTLRTHGWQAAESYLARIGGRRPRNNGDAK